MSVRPSVRPAEPGRGQQISIHSRRRREPAAGRVCCRRSRSAAMRVASCSEPRYEAQHSLERINRLWRWITDDYLSPALLSCLLISLFITREHYRFAAIEAILYSVKFNRLRRSIRLHTIIIKFLSPAQLLSLKSLSLPCFCCLIKFLCVIHFVTARPYASADTAKHRITQTKPHDIPGTIVF